MVMLQKMPSALIIQLDFTQDRTLRELSSAKGIARKAKERGMALHRLAKDQQANARLNKDRSKCDISSKKRVALDMN